MFAHCIKLPVEASVEHPFEKPALSAPHHHHPPPNYMKISTTRGCLGRVGEGEGIISSAMASFYDQV